MSSSSSSRATKQRRTLTELPLPDIPNDVHQHILSLAPIKSIVRFGMVSKEWQQMLKSKRFVKKHRDNFTAASSQEVLLRSYLYTTDPRSALYVLNLETREIRSFGFDFQQRTTVVGCINGVVCFTVPNITPTALAFDSRILYANNPSLIFLNPATRMFKLIPNPNLTFGDRNYFVFHCFGHDEEKDDFKVLVIDGAYKDGNLEEFAAQVYSSDSNEWVTVNINFPFCEEKRVSVRETTYWFGVGKLNKEDQLLLVWFDFKQMVFNKAACGEGLGIQPVEDILNPESIGIPTNAFLDNWKGKLVMVVKTVPFGVPGAHYSANIWVFDPIQKVWEANDVYSPCLPLPRTVECSVNGNFIEVDYVHATGVVVVYDPQRGEIDRIPVDNKLPANSPNVYSRSLRAYVYSESLDSISGMRALRRLRRYVFNLRPN